MATASETQAPATIDSTWENQDAQQRLVTLEGIDPQSDSNQQLLIRVAHEDEHEEVRCSAISRITDLAALKEIHKLQGTAKDSALQQSIKILAGNIDSTYTEQERIEQIPSLSLPVTKQIALITRSKVIASKAIDNINATEELADLCLFASSVHTRKQAAQSINDEILLKEILKKVADKDKTVSKLIRERLGSTDNNDGSTEKPTTNAAVAPESPDPQKESSKENSKESKTHSEALKENETEIKEDKDVEKNENINLEADLEIIEGEATKLSHKNTIRLYELRSQLRKVLKEISDSEAELLQRAKQTQTKLSEKISANNDYQEQLKNKTEALLDSLAEALESGSSKNATQCWDKIQGNISNTENQIRAELKKKADVHKAKLIELRDWKVFAATEKKKELITQMQHLLDSKMHASDRSKNISKLHKEWKLLGRSNQNEALWKQFKQLSDQAYEPCKEYFKQRKQLMAENLKKRKEICSALEEELKRLNEIQDGTQSDTEGNTQINISALNKLLSAAEKDWKQHAPIEQSKIKSLQKRFYATVNQLRKMRKGEVSAHAKLKKELIAKAQALTTQEDNKSAMNEAKQLQQEWKKIGPTSYKDDNKYWHDFRAACDIIFNKRDQESSALKENLKQVEKKLTELLVSLNKLFDKTDDDFRKARTEYQDLAQTFSNSLDPRLKSQRKRLLDQFNTIKRKIDSRYKSLPDKRQLFARNAILEKAKFLEQLENSLLNESQQEKFKAYKDSLDQGAWDNLEASGNSSLDNDLDQRLKTILATSSHDEINKLAQQNELKFRELCVQVEIRSNAETPAEDKTLRMKLQLEQLQCGFGHAKPDSKENIKYALESELQSYVIGPLENSVREKLGARLSQALKKLR
jgi:hypothetical protein